MYVFWNLGTFVGAVVGAALGDLDRWGLDAAFPAAFVALLIPHLRTRPGRVAAVSGAALCLVAIPLLPVGLPIPVGALGVIPAARPPRRVDGGPPTRREP